MTVETAITYTGERYWTNTRNINPKWTDEKLEELKKLLADGLSASKIAHKLGFATRSAVIGKIHRLKLTNLRPSKPQSQGRPLRQPQYQTRSEKIKAGQAAYNFLNHLADQQNPQHRQRVILLEGMTAPSLDTAIPLEQRKTLFELTNCTCKWPCGNPGEENFFFCGATTNNTTYCKHHHLRAVQ